MRIAAGLIFAGAVSLLVSGSGVVADAAAAKATRSHNRRAQAAPAPQLLPPPQRRTPPRRRLPQPGQAACNNPDALGIGRVVEIDTTGGPGFGFEHFKQLDFLRDKEVVLTFDDGPWPVNTPARAEGAGGRMHDRHLLPDRQARHLLSGDPEAGCRGRPHHRLAHLVARDSDQQEADRRRSARKRSRRASARSNGRWAAPPAPFFRFPALQHPPEMVTYLGDRNIAMFSCDLDSFDFKARKPQASHRHRDARSSTSSARASS